MLHGTEFTRHLPVSRIGTSYAKQETARKDNRATNFVAATMRAKTEALFTDVDFERR